MIETIEVTEDFIIFEIDDTRFRLTKAGFENSDFWVMAIEDEEALPEWVEAVNEEYYSMASDSAPIDFFNVITSKHAEID